MPLQYSPSIEIGNSSIADAVIFKAKRRAVLIGFDYVTPAEESSLQKRALLSSGNIRSTVQLLRHALYLLLAS